MILNPVAFSPTRLGYGWEFSLKFHLPELRRYIIVTFKFLISCFMQTLGLQTANMPGHTHENEHPPPERCSTHSRSHVCKRCHTQFYFHDRPLFHASTISMQSLTTVFIFLWHVARVVVTFSCRRATYDHGWCLYSCSWKGHRSKSQVSGEGWLRRTWLVECYIFFISINFPCWDKTFGRWDIDLYYTKLNYACSLHFWLACQEHIVLNKFTCRSGSLCDLFFLDFWITFTHLSCRKTAHITLCFCIWRWWW